MRSRANDACMAMGGWLAIALSDSDHQESDEFILKFNYFEDLNSHAGGASL